MSTLKTDCILNIPSPLVILNDSLDLMGASRMAFSMFRVRYVPQKKHDNLAALSDILLQDQSFVFAVGESTLKLTRVGSSTSLRWSKGNRVFDIEIAAMDNHEGGLLFALCFNDISRKMEVEHGRETTRNFLEQIIDSLPIGIVVVDRDMRITAINRAQQEMMAAPENDVSILSAVGSLLYDFMPQHDGLPWTHVADRLFKEKKAIHRLEHSREANGAIRTYSSSVLPLQRENGEVIGAMHLTEDISEKVRLMADARDADMLAARLETLQHTVVTLNHVINNKLMTLMCNLEVVRSTGEPLTPTKLRMVNEAQDEAESIAQFIRDLSNVREIKITDYLKGGQKMLDVYGKEQSS